MENEMENTEQRAKSPRVARCMVCSNEWVARDGSKKKPSRCPECLSRNVAWRDECEPNPDELTEEPVPEVEIPEEEEEITGYVLPDGSGAAFGVVGTPDEEASLEAIAKRTPRINPIGFILVIGALTAAGLAFFLLRKGKGQLKKQGGKTQEQEIPAHPKGYVNPPQLYGGLF